MRAVCINDPLGKGGDIENNNIGRHDNQVEKILMILFRLDATYIGENKMLEFWDMVYILAKLIIDIMHSNDGVTRELDSDSIPQRECR